MNTNVPSLRILLVENDHAAADELRAALTAAGGSFDVQWVRQLSHALACLSKKGIDAILLKLSLPDSHGMETFDKLFAAVPDVPILILDNGNEALAKEAVARGAHDYLPPGHLEYSLPRALRNAIERKAVDDALYLEKERAVVTLNSIGDAVLCTDIAGNITYLNLVAETMTGWQREEAIGKRLSEVFRIIDGPTRKTARDPMEMAVEQDRTVGLTVNCVLIRRDGFESTIEDSAAPIHDRAGRVIGAVIVFHDVSAARAMSLQMTHSAQYDLVTNLPNRQLLNDRVSQAIALARRQNRPIAVLFLDLDRFKYINDSLGHVTGDKLLHYQAKVNLDTSEITGVEALIRWLQPDRGLVPPSQFVPIAEDCGLIVQIGHWVLREACRQARAWQEAGLTRMPLSVNVSACEFREKGFVEGVRAALSETGLEARYLELELTEGVLMEHAKSTASVLQELKTMGVHLAVDDFGTGYSSLSYLRQFPIDVLKIDQSFIHQITSDPDDSEIVSAIISMARSLKHLVVAEGIEAQEQRAYLQTQRCAEGQGYLFSRPLAAAQFAHLLQTGISETEAFVH